MAAESGPITADLGMIDGDAPGVTCARTCGGGVVDNEV